MTSSDTLLTDQQFKVISSIALKYAGLEIPKQKNAMVCARVTKRVRDLKFANLQSYCENISKEGQESEIFNLISTLTTNVTRFYREPHHFNTLRNSIIPGLKRKSINGEPIRIWSAGCSEGMELLTVAMELLKAFPDGRSYNFHLLGTDIDAQIIERARRAEYRSSIEDQMGSSDLKQFFTKTSNGYRATPSLRQMTTFNTLNLHEAWPIRQKFDIIFCRNVVIYFDQKTRDTLWPRFARQLNPDGYLFLGHSERITGPGEDLFNLAGTTTYRLAQNTTKQVQSVEAKDIANGIA